MARRGHFIPPRDFDLIESGEDLASEPFHRLSEKHRRTCVVFDHWGVENAIYPSPTASAIWSSLGITMSAPRAGRPNIASSTPASASVSIPLRLAPLAMI